MEYPVEIEGVPIPMTVLIRGWGQEFGARELGGSRVTLRLIRGAIAIGRDVRLLGAPLYHGTTSRRVIERGRRLYTRIWKEQ